MTIKITDLLVLQPDQASLTEVYLPLLPKGWFKGVCVSTLAARFLWHYVSQRFVISCLVLLVRVIVFDSDGIRISILSPGC